MPNRILKESVKRSEQIDQLTWFEEVVFYRLILTADDYGCLDGRVVLLKNDLFPTKDNVTKKAVEDAISKLASVGLLCKYTVNGKPYLFFPTWTKHQRLRNQHRKYPNPADADVPIGGHLTVICQSNVSQETADCPSELELEEELELESEGVSNTKRDCTPAPAREEIQSTDYTNEDYLKDLKSLGKTLQEAIKKWVKYKKQQNKALYPVALKELMERTKAYAKKYGEDKVAEIFSLSISNQYDGVVLDRLDKQSSRGGGRSDRRREEHDYEADMEDTL